MSKIFRLCRDMAAVSRWSQAQCITEESVLEHTAFVAIYALRLAYKYDADVGDVLERAVVHDMEEAITGDITTPMKYYNTEITTAIKKIEDAAAVEISHNFFFGCMYHPWAKSKSLNDDAGCIVYIADTAASVYKLWIEKQLGNTTFGQYNENIRRRLVQVTKSFPEKFHGEIQTLIKELENLK
jgi:5'-deoxynucleotidase YfbR-like HD superfamily hydrolase